MAVRVGVQTGGFQEPDDIAVKRRVVVKQHEAIRTIARKYIPQLLHDPRGCRLASHVDVQDHAPTVLDDEEAREQLEGQRGDGEEIAGDDRLAVVGEEGRPAAGGIAAAWHAAQIPGDAAFGDVEAELQEFPVDPGRPQPAFSVARRRMRVRISSLIRGRCRDRQRQ